MLWTILHVVDDSTCCGRFHMLWTGGSRGVEGGRGGSREVEGGRGGSRGNDLS